MEWLGGHVVSSHSVAYISFSVYLLFIIHCLSSYSSNLRREKKKRSNQQNKWVTGGTGRCVFNDSIHFATQTHRITKFGRDLQGHPYSHPPGTATLTPKPHHKHQIQMPQAPPGIGTPPLPRETYSNAWPPWQWKSSFLLPNLNVPCYGQWLIAICSCPLTAGETDPHLTTPSFQDL